MAAREPLRAVTEADGLPVSLEVGSVTEAAEGGSMRELLVALRSRTARAVEDSKTPARDLAALTRRLLEIAREIEAIDVKAGQEADERGGVPDEVLDASAF